MTDFLTSDTHFGHANCIKHDRRPFSCVEEMDDVIVRIWNSHVSKNDTVYHLGDFAWKNHASYRARLNGKIVLILGTHDKMPQEALRNFTEVIGKNHQPGILCRKLCGQDFVMSHYPQATWERMHYGVMHVHGHSHGGLPEYSDCMRCDIGVSVWGYAPVPVETIIKKLGARLDARASHQVMLDESRQSLYERIDELKKENEAWRRGQ